MAGPLKVNIPTFKPIESPYEPDFNKSLASLMQAYSYMARAQAARSAAAAAADPMANAEAAVARGDAYWKYYPNPNDPNNPTKTLIWGKNGDVRKANEANADREYLTGLLANDQAIINKLAGLDEFSAKKAKDTLNDIRQNDLKRIKALSGGMDAKQILEVMLAPHQTKVNERLKAIEDDSTWNILWQKVSSEGEVALKNLGSFMSPNDSREDVAHGEEINRIRKEAEDNSAYLREQALRASEGESWLDRSEGFGGNLLNTAITVAEAVPNVGVSIAAPVIGTAVAGPAGFYAGLGVAGGFNAASQRGEFLARVAADPNLTEEQKLSAAEGGETFSSLVGFGTGMIPAPVGKFTGQALRMVGNKIAPKMVSSAPARTLQGQLKPTPVRDLLTAGYEGGVMSGLDMMGQNILYEYATGLDTPVFQNVGDAIIMGAVGGAPFGAVQTFANRPRPIPQINQPNVPGREVVDPLGLPVGAIPELPVGSTVPPTDPSAGPVPPSPPVGPAPAQQLGAAQGRARPVPMGTTETAASQPIPMNTSVPDTPEQRLYNALVTIDKSDKNAKNKVESAVRTYGQEGGTLTNLTALAAQVRLSNKKLAALAPEQRLFIGDKPRNAPLNELTNIARRIASGEDTTIFGVNQNASTQTPAQVVAEATPEGTDTGSSPAPATAGVGPDGQPRADTGTGANLVGDSGVAAPVAAPVTDLAAGTAGPVVQGDRAVEGGGVGGSTVPTEPTNQVPEILVEPTGTGPATDASLGGPDNRLAAGSGTPTDTSAGVQPNTGRGGNDGTADAASAGIKQQPTGGARLDPQAFNQRPADMPKVNTEGLTTDTTPATDTDAAVQQLLEIREKINDKTNQRVLADNIKKNNNYGTDPVAVPDSVTQTMRSNTETSSASKKTTSEKAGATATNKRKKVSKGQELPVKEASESDTIAALNSIDNRTLPAKEKQQLTTLLYKEALGESLKKNEQTLLDNARNSYDLPRISKLSEPDLTDARTADELINTLSPKYWYKHSDGRLKSAGEALFIMRQGRDNNDWQLAQKYDMLRSKIDELQNLSIKDQLIESGKPYKLKVMTASESAKLQTAREGGMPDTDVPSNLDVKLQEYEQAGKSVDPVIAARALKDPDSSYAKILERSLCPSVT